ncbi:MAG TPA: clostripain-related cysteine peptidase, partial [Chitinophagaceae bacterium]|nr:clostripain-related cysteine peptidase [Chitinophagaceae bacterium]
LGNEKTLENILKRIRAEVGEESKIMLFTWDHGSAFGVFNSEELDFVKAPPVKSEPKTDMLMISELSDAIRNSFGKVEMLIMMNCWMQSIETNAQLKGCVDVLVGAETTIDWLGYNYIKIINKLVDDLKEDKPNEPLQPYLNKFAKIIIDDTINKYKELEPTDVKIKEIILSATRPNSEERDELTKGINNTATFLNNNLNQTINTVIEARKNTQELTLEFGGGGRPWCFVDILDVFMRINKEGLLTKNGFIDTFKKIFPQSNSYPTFYQNDITKFIVARFIGDNFSGEKSTGNYGGISICFPNNKGFIKSYFYRKFYKFENEKGFEKISFAKSASAWPAFTENAINNGLKRNTPPDKNLSFVLKGTFETDETGVKFNSSIDKCFTESPDGEMVSVNLNALPKDQLLRLNNFDIQMDVDINIISQDIHFNSLELECSEDKNGKKFIYNIIRGAGEPKTRGPGEPKTRGPGQLIKLGLEERE